MLTCYIIINDKSSIDIIDNISKIPNLILNGHNANPLIALSEIQQRQKTDIVFIDLEIPDFLSSNIRNLLPPEVAVVLISTQIEHAYNALEVDAVDFLLMPHQFDRFYKSIMKARIYLNQFQSVKKNSSNDSIFISSGAKILYIKISDILYVESYNHTISIVCLNEKHSIYKALSDIENILPTEHFIRVHRSFIINISVLKSIEGNNILLTNSINIPLGDTYKNRFMQIITNLMISCAPLLLQ